METQDCLGMGPALPQWYCSKLRWWRNNKHVESLAVSQTNHFEQRCIVWLHHCVRHLWRRDDGEGFHNASVVRSSWKMSAGHVWKLEVEFAKGTEKNWENIYKTYCKWDAVWIFLTHFGDQQCAHSSAGAATERMAKLEALQTSLVELLKQKERPLSLHLHSTEYWRRNKAWNNCLDLFGKVAVTPILFKTSISRIPLLLFGQHQVLSQSTQHLRCSDPDRFFNYKLCFPLLALQCISQWSSGYLPKMLITKNHTKVKPTNPTQPCLRPIVARTCRCFDNSNTEMQSFGNSTS